MNNKEKLVLELGKASNSGGKTSWISVNERLPEKAGAYLVKEETE